MKNPKGKMLIISTALMIIFIIAVAAAIKIVYNSQNDLRVKEFPFIEKNKNQAAISKSSRVNKNIAIQKSYTPSYLVYLGRFGFGFKVFAYIKNTNSNQKNIYAVGDSVDSYLVRAIKNEEVILRKNNEDYRIFLTSEFTGHSDPGEAITVVSENKRIIHIPALFNNINNQNYLLNKIVLLPYIEQGRILGIKVNRLADEQILRKSGIMKGDIIRSVNGIPLRGFRDVQQIYNSVRHTGQCSVEIARNGRYSTLFYSLERCK